ncbi:AAA family ATPase, partial [Neobacillus vireti]|uniref:AAA family ATPase n=1 Tax=Neobacillus vireti TaxID=220686 RepID=UPI002FFEDA6B
IDFDVKDVKNQRYLNLRTNRFVERNFSNTLVKCDFSFSASNNNDENDLTQLHPELEKSKISIYDSNDPKKEIENINIFRARENASDRIEKLQLQNCTTEEVTTLEYEVEIKSNNTIPHEFYYSHKKKGDFVGVKMLHFLPEKLTVKFDEILEVSKQIVALFIDGDMYYRFYTVEELNANVNQKFKDIIMNEVMAVHLALNKKLDRSVGKQRLEKINNKFIDLKENFHFQTYYAFLQSLTANSKKELLNNIKQNENKLLNSLISNKEPKYVLDQIALPTYLDFAVSNVQRYFSRNVKYLGPLRDEPKPIYPHSGTTDSKDVGFKGEHTAAVLEIHKNYEIQYISPNELDKEIPQVIKGQLIEAVLEWLEYMGVVKDVETIDRGKLGHELKVQLEGGSSYHDLTNVGVGVSQVLPILVLSLLAEKNSTLIFEQPELHLHPRVQTRLADFFVSMIHLKKQCILETHSEYLINRLRYRSVVSNSDEISKDVIMYFVEQEDGKSTYSPVRINKYGVIEEWPKGFFDESEENASAILKAALEKRKRERKK